MRKERKKTQPVSCRLYQENLGKIHLVVNEVFHDRIHCPSVLFHS